MVKNENVAREEAKRTAEIIQLYFEDNHRTKKSTYRSIKNAILSFVTIISILLIVNLIGAWKNNVPNMIPYLISAGIGLLWLLLFGYANRDELIYRG